jgi:thiamine biosynthesis lipoprotein
MRVLEAALEVSRLSGGAFDITAAPLVALWSVTAQHPAVPPEDALAQKRDLIDFNCLTLDAASGSARLARQGQMVDLGGIAKGYAADQALEVYRRRGISTAMIDLGGNIALLGSKEDGAPWGVGIQDPDAPRGECLGLLSLTDKSVVTSGDYERFFEAGGKRYHHILDPRTGYPAESGLRSVTVVAEKSMVADGLSTALFVLGLERGLALLDSIRAGTKTSQGYSSVEVLFITAAGKVHLTPGLADAYTPILPLPVTVCV